jgi:hypothetical protein
MKIVFIILTVVSSFAYAQTTETQANLIKNNLEVKSVIKAFETNRSQKCQDISAENILITKSGLSKVTLSCNEYKDGESMANVYIIKLKGYLYGSIFDLNSVSITGAE